MIREILEILVETTANFIQYSVILATMIILASLLEEQVGSTWKAGFLAGIITLLVNSIAIYLWRIFIW